MAGKSPESNLHVLARVASLRSPARAEPRDQARAQSRSRDPQLAASTNACKPAPAFACSSDPFPDPSSCSSAIDPSVLSSGESRDTICGQSEAASRDLGVLSRHWRAPVHHVSRTADLSAPNHDHGSSLSSQTTTDGGESSEHCGDLSAPNDLVLDLSLPKTVKDNKQEKDTVTSDLSSLNVPEPNRSAPSGDCECETPRNNPKSQLKEPESHPGKPADTPAVDPKLILGEPRDNPVDPRRSLVDCPLHLNQPRANSVDPKDNPVEQKDNLVDPKHNLGEPRDNPVDPKDNQCLGFKTNAEMNQHKQPHLSAGPQGRDLSTPETNTEPHQWMNIDQSETTKIPPLRTTADRDVPTGTLCRISDLSTLSASTVIDLSARAFDLSQRRTRNDAMTGQNDDALLNTNDASLTLFDAYTDDSSASNDSGDAHICEFCGRVFSAQGTLEAHVQKKHASAEGLAFPCIECADLSRAKGIKTEVARYMCMLQKHAPNPQSTEPGEPGDNPVDPGDNRVGLEDNQGEPERNLEESETADPGNNLDGIHNNLVDPEKKVGHENTPVGPKDQEDNQSDLQRNVEEDYQPGENREDMMVNPGNNHSSPTVDPVEPCRNSVGPEGNSEHNLTGCGPVEPGHNPGESQNNPVGPEDNPPGPLDDQVDLDDRQVEPAGGTTGRNNHQMEEESERNPVGSKDNQVEKHEDNQTGKVDGKLRTGENQVELEGNPIEPRDNPVRIGHSHSGTQYCGSKEKPEIIPPGNPEKQDLMHLENEDNQPEALPVKARSKTGLNGQPSAGELGEGTTRGDVSPHSLGERETAEDCATPRAASATEVLKPEDDGPERVLGTIQILGAFEGNSSDSPGNTSGATAMENPPVTQEGSDVSKSGNGDVMRTDDAPAPVPSLAKLHAIPSGDSDSTGPPALPAIDQNVEEMGEASPVDNSGNSDAEMAQGRLSEVDSGDESSGSRKRSRKLTDIVQRLRTKMQTKRDAISGSMNDGKNPERGNTVTTPETQESEQNREALSDRDSPCKSSQSQEEIDDKSCDVTRDNDVTAAEKAGRETRTRRSKRKLGNKQRRDNMNSDVTSDEENGTPRFKKTTAMEKTKSNQGGKGEGVKSSKTGAKRQKLPPSEPDAGESASTTNRRAELSELGNQEQNQDGADKSAGGTSLRKKEGSTAAKKKREAEAKSDRKREADDDATSADKNGGKREEGRQHHVNEREKDDVTCGKNREENRETRSENGAPRSTQQSSHQSVKGLGLKSQFESIFPVERTNKEKDAVNIATGCSDEGGKSSSHRETREWELGAVNSELTASQLRAYIFEDAKKRRGTFDSPLGAALYASSMTRVYNRATENKMAANMADASSTQHKVDKNSLDAADQEKKAEETSAIPHWRKMSPERGPASGISRPRTPGTSSGELWMQELVSGFLTDAGRSNKKDMQRHGHESRVLCGGGPDDPCVTNSDIGKEIEIKRKELLDVTESDKSKDEETRNSKQDEANKKEEKEEAGTGKRKGSLKRKEGKGGDKDRKPNFRSGKSDSGDTLTKLKKRKQPEQVSPSGGKRQKQQPRSEKIAASTANHAVLSPGNTELHSNNDHSATNKNLPDVDPIPSSQSKHRTARKTIVKRQDPSESSTTQNKGAMTSSKRSDDAQRKSKNKSRDTRTLHQRGETRESRKTKRDAGSDDEESASVGSSRDSASRDEYSASGSEWEHSENDSASVDQSRDGDGFACLYCTRKFPSSAEVEEHARCTHACSHCDRMFNTKSKRETHMRVHTAQRPFVCKECDKCFTQKSNLSSHMAVHSTKKLHSCETCGKSFRYKHQLQNHRRTHDGHRPYECEICYKTFRQSGHLRTHERTHTDERPFQCPECNKSFREKSKLNLHMRTHSDERPYPCPQCDKSFRRPYHLRVHLFSHTQERAFVCDICDMRFKSGDYLRKHRKTHTDIKPHRCTVCGKRFRESAQLATHMRMHNDQRDYPCAICKKRFRHKMDVKHHMVTHTGARPHACTICSKAFGMKQTLTKHMLVHTDERPFDCDVCGFAFKEAQKLKKHRRLHDQQVKEEQSKDKQGKSHNTRNSNENPSPEKRRKSNANTDRKISAQDTNTSEEERRTDKHRKTNAQSTKARPSADKTRKTKVKVDPNPEKHRKTNV